MLRRRFLLVLGSLVGLLMATAVTAIVLLQGVLTDLDALGVQTVEGTTLVLRLGGEVTQLQAVLNGRGGTGSPENGAPAVPPETMQTDDGGVYMITASMRDNMRQLAGTEVLQRQQAASEAATRFMALLNEFATTAAPASSGQEGEVDRRAALALAVLPRLRAELGGIDEALHRGLEEEQGRVVYRFRLIALGLGLVFVVVINLSVMAVSRIMSMVLKPVDALVEASRRLACEDFAHRVQLERDDEFGELGRAYNSLAQQLQSNEQRKVETMHQVARTLSHEVNNAISIIEMQLALLARGASASSGSPTTGKVAAPSPRTESAGESAQAERLSQIRQSLGRISRTVEALTRVRRIVLTDYLAGVSMLDLERSVEDAPSQAGTAATPGVIT